MYRRADVTHFVTWARATILRLREIAEQATARANAAEARIAEAVERARLAEARAADAEASRADAERALHRRDHDMHAVLGKALLHVQRAADQIERRGHEAIVKAQAETERAKAEAEAARAERDEAVASARESRADRVFGLWGTDDDDESVLAPLRSLRTGDA